MAMRVQYTLDGFDSLARYLVGIPGRKNVIWFSGSFPLDIEPNPDEADPNDSVKHFDAWVRETDHLQPRAPVEVYPVDEGGCRGPLRRASSTNQETETLSFFQAEDGIRDTSVTGVQTCALPISSGESRRLRVCSTAPAAGMPK